jgi:hypothetical protein
MDLLTLEGLRGTLTWQEESQLLDAANKYQGLPTVDAGDTFVGGVQNEGNRLRHINRGICIGN